MKSFSVLRNLTSIALTACCAIGVSSAGAQIRLSYTLTDLGVLPDQKPNVTRPAAISGQAKDGQVQVAGTSDAFAFRYTSGSKIPMEYVDKNAAESISRGFGINGSGQVVGDSTFGTKTTSHAAMFSDGSATDLGTLKDSGNFSRANGINAYGQVIGFSSETLDGASSRAFIVGTSSYSSPMIDLGTLGGAHAQALAINDSGFVTGNSQTHTADRPDSIHAFIWHAATGPVSESLEIPSNPNRRRMLDLGALDGHFSYGTSISSKNHVAGYSTINNFDDRVHAFLYNGEKMIDLGSLSGASLESDRSYALGVNAADQVVGYSYLSWFCLECDQEETVSPSVHSPRQVAFIYEGGFMLNLNDLIGDAAQNYRLDAATAINDQGQIVAIAYDYNAGAVRAVLLTPLSR